MRMSKEESRSKILSFIRDEIQNKGYPPSVREICKAVGFKSTSSVHAYLRELEHEGMLRRDATKPRAMELTDNPKGRAVPLVGRVTAGVPILAQQNIEDEIVLPQDMVRGEDVFALRVEGQSMIEAGILDKDIVVVRRQANAENGEIVVAMIEDEATVKTYSKQNGHVWLLPENDAYEPIDGTYAVILGRVAAVVRRY